MLCCCFVFSKVQKCGGHFHGLGAKGLIPEDVTNRSLVCFYAGMMTMFNLRATSDFTSTKELTTTFHALSETWCTASSFCGIEMEDAQPFFAPIMKKFVKIRTAQPFSFPMMGWVDHFLRICASENGNRHSIAVCLCNEIVQRLDDEAIGRLLQPAKFELWKMTSLVLIITEIKLHPEKEPNTFAVKKLEILSSQIASLTSRLQNVVNEGTSIS
jgi:hypothetical protein